MILLDTNVLSKVMRPRPHQAVIDWLNAADGGALDVAAVTIGEIEYGLDILPDGQRRDALRARFDAFVRRVARRRSYDPLTLGDPDVVYRSLLAYFVGAVR